MSTFLFLSCFFYSQVVIMVVLEAAQTNSDHFYNHGRGVITKDNSSALIPGYKSSRKGATLGVLLGGNVFFLSTFLSDRSLKLFVSCGKAKSTECDNFLFTERFCFCFVSFP